MRAAWRDKGPSQHQAFRLEPQQRSFHLGVGKPEKGSQVCDGDRAEAFHPTLHDGADRIFRFRWRLGLKARRRVNAQRRQRRIEAHAGQRGGGNDNALRRNQRRVLAPARDRGTAILDEVSRKREAEREKRRTRSPLPLGIVDFLRFGGFGCRGSSGTARMDASNRQCRVGAIPESPLHPRKIDSLFTPIFTFTHFQYGCGHT